MKRARGSRFFELFASRGFGVNILLKKYGSNAGKVVSLQGKNYLLDQLNIIKPMLLKLGKVSILV